RPAVAAPSAERVAVAPEDLDALGRQAEPVAHDLSKGRLVALSHRRRAREERHGAVRIDAHLGRVRIDTRIRSARDLDGIGDAETQELAAPASLRATLLEARVVRRGERQIHDRPEADA